MKRYLVFTGSDYYPRGGMNDFKRDFDELAPAIAFAQGSIAEEADYKWAHVYDTTERKKVWESD